MLEGIGQSGGPQRIERQGGVNRLERTAAVQPTGTYDIPASPPADLLHELDRAASVIDDLAARQVNVHFAIDDKTGKVHVQVVDGQGQLIREIPTPRLFDVLSSGSSSGLAVNMVG